MKKKELPPHKESRGQLREEESSESSSDYEEVKVQKKMYKTSQGFGIGGYRQRDEED